jgi:hypothetical protein
MPKAINLNVMTMRQTLITLVVVVAGSVATLGAGYERIWLNAKINGKPVHLAFDSGSNVGALCPQTVQKLGLKFIPAPTNALFHGFMAGDTEDCTLALEGMDMEGKTSFLVLDLPVYLGTDADFDGVLGYYLVSNNVARIDAVAGDVTLLKKVPKQTAQWARFSVLTNYGTLDLQIPHGDHSNGVLRIDTGSGSGFALPAQEWRRWREGHPQSPITIDTHTTLDEGFDVVEEAWADQISVGPLVLTGVPIEVTIVHAGPARTNWWGTQYEGTLGLAALKRLDFIVDGNNGLAYLQAKKTRPPAYPHNRLGAIFAATTTQTNQAVARVVDGSPAYEAGVRNGDVLLQVDDVKVTSWSASWIDRFRRPAGTRLNLVLKRDGQTVRVTATLRDILERRLSKWN